ncbi:MAG: immunoglobulin domain-containing protein, partial [Lachnospiraceae bacterium]|nr:immunoglobulin domain-containing protein [Lachnospiraceae bacterium]
MDDKYWIKKERKRQWYLLGAVLCLGLLILGCLPVSVFAAGIQGGGVAARSTHSHDMSVECGNDAPLDYLPLTGDGDGKLYIDGTEVAISTSGLDRENYILPEGNYYLADNITVHQGVSISSGKTVNLCLNGKTLQIQTEDGFGIWIEEDGKFYLSDCGSEGRITAGFIVLESSRNGKFIMYGGCLECTMTAGTVIYLVNSGVSAEIYGGTIKSDRGIGIASDDRTQCKLSLLGNPVFVGNMVDVNSYVTLCLNALDCNRNERIKVSRDTELSVGESQMLDSIRALDGVDYSTVLAGREGKYFTYKDGNYFVNRAGVTRQPTSEEVSVDVLPAEGAAYQWYEVVERDVTADRGIITISDMMVTIFTLQAGDTLYFTLPETPTTSEDMGGDAVALMTAEGDEILVTSLGDRRYKGIVENNVSVIVVYLTESNDLKFASFEEGTYEVIAVTQGDAVSGQTINTLTKAAAGTYMCEVTWENLGCCVNSELVELTEAVDAGWTLDADGKLTIASDDGMRNWIENRDACKELVRTAEILEDVTDIKDSAFYGCSSLARVTMLGEMPPELGGSEVFTGCSFVADNTKGIFVPIGKADAYKNAWGDYADYITDGYPEIVTQPTNQSVKNGEQATFSVTAQGVLQPLTYQWQVNKNGTEESGFSNIANATSDTYTITVDKNCNGYWYRCVVTNERGSVTSSALELTVTDSDADKIAAAKAVVEKVLADYTAVNDSTSEDIQNKINTALSSEGITDVTVTVGELAVEKATESEEGSISGSIAIECGSEEDSVTVNKTIAKLPTSDTDKIAAAKAVVEKALAGIVATNETTKEDIQRVVDTALTNAGISDVTVTVGALSKTEATTSAEGSVSGSIAIECG